MVLLLSKIYVMTARSCWVRLVLVNRRLYRRGRPQVLVLLTRPQISGCGQHLSEYRHTSKTKINVVCRNVDQAFCRQKVLAVEIATPCIVRRLPAVKLWVPVKPNSAKINIWDSKVVFGKIQKEFVIDLSQQLNWSLIWNRHQAASGFWWIQFHSMVATKRSVNAIVLKTVRLVPI